MNQDIAKRGQDRQIWYVNDGVMLRWRYMQIKRLQAMKESTPGLYNDLGVKITSAGNFVRKKK